MADLKPFFSPSNLRDCLQLLAQLLVNGMAERMEYPAICVQIICDAPKYVIADSSLRMDALFSSADKRMNEPKQNQVLLLQNWWFELQSDRMTNEPIIIVIIEKFELLAPLDTINNYCSPSFNEDLQLEQTRSVFLWLFQTMPFNARFLPKESVQKLKSVLIPANETNLQYNGTGSQIRNEEQKFSGQTNSQSGDSIFSGFYSVSSSLYLEIEGGQPQNDNLSITESSERKHVKVNTSKQYRSELVNKRTAVSKFMIGEESQIQRDQYFLTHYRDETQGPMVKESSPQNPVRQYRYLMGSNSQCQKIQEMDIEEENEGYSYRFEDRVARGDLVGEGAGSAIKRNFLKYSAQSNCVQGLLREPIPMKRGKYTGSGIDAD